MEGKDKFKKGDLVCHYRKHGIILEVETTTRPVGGVKILWSNGQTSAIFFGSLAWGDIEVLARA